jgi:hypothetical protein
MRNLLPLSSGCQKKKDGASKAMGKPHRKPMPKKGKFFLMRENKV